MSRQLLQAEAAGEIEAGAELLSQCAMLLFAGHETTRNLLGNGLQALLAELIDGEWINDDVQALRLAGTLPLTAAEVGPLQLRTACAPHVAAQIDGRSIDRALLLQAARDLAARADVLVVEGVRGFCVPLGEGWDMPTWPSTWRCRCCSSPASASAV